jgi:hypothetical protein
MTQFSELSEMICCKYYTIASVKIGSEIPTGPVNGQKYRRIGFRVWAKLAVRI